MKKLKTQKGITLIALIITIVVLLILAVVAIGAVRDSNIIAHAQNAASGYNKAKANELDILTEYETTLNKYAPEANNETEWILQMLKIDGEIDNEQKGVIYCGNSKNLTLTAPEIIAEVITIEINTETEEQNVVRNGELKQIDLREINTIYFMVDTSPNLEIIDLGNNLGSSCNIQFNQLTNLIEVKGLEGITELQEDTFDQCTKLKNVVLPATITSISYATFRECTSLEMVTLLTTDADAINIGSASDCPMFYNCSSNIKIYVLNQAMKDKIESLGYSSVEIISE